MTASAKTASYGAIKPAIQALEAGKHSPVPVLRAVGLPEDLTETSPQRFPLAAAIAFWEAAAKAARDPDFGLHAAELCSGASGTLVDFLFINSATLGESFSRCTEFIRLVIDRSAAWFSIDGRTSKLSRARLRDDAGRHYFEYALSGNVLRGRRVTGVDWTPNKVMFGHPRPRSGTAAHERIFRCELDFSAPVDSLELDTALCALPIQNANPKLNQFLVHLAAEELALLPQTTGFLAQVRQVLQRALGEELPAMGRTARSLHVSTRTLQRKLESSGRTFQGLVDEVRRDLALRDVSDTGYTLAEVSQRLHFSAQSAFTRAFKRWTAETPGQYRARFYKPPAEQ